MDTNDSAAVRQQIQTHLRVFWILLLVVGANVATTFLPVNPSLRIAVQVGLAVLGGSIVLVFYMHLLSETLSTYLLLGCTGFLFLALLVLSIAAYADHRDVATTYGAPAPMTQGEEHEP